MAEVVFMWEDKTVNLKLARSIVRYVAENHRRLGEIGPTQALRDILAWFKQCAGENNSFPANVQTKYGSNADFGNVCLFLKTFDYDSLKKRFPKECSSLWMAVRGVFRKQSTQQYEDSNSVANGSQNGSMGMSHVDKIKQSSDNMAFEVLMLLGNPQNLCLQVDDYQKLEQVRTTLMTVVEDLNVLLRQGGHGHQQQPHHQQPQQPQHPGIHQMSLAGAVGNAAESYIYANHDSPHSVSSGFSHGSLFQTYDTNKKRNVMGLLKQESD